LSLYLFPPEDYLGGFIIGGDSFNTTSCFWDTQTTGVGYSDGGTGKTTAQMKTESTFTSAGWDFSTIWEIVPSINDGYPYLRWAAPWAGDYDVYQVVWFQPEDIISGTTLPNRAGFQDGDITWGSNPSGISAILAASSIETSAFITTYLSLVLDRA